MKDYKKLIMVADSGVKGNNKYYEMIWDGGATFEVKYGRVESTETVLTYDYSLWNRKYNEKVKKGYKDVTQFVSQTDDTGAKTPKKKAAISDNSVATFMQLMEKYTNNLVSTTYSVKASQVTQEQIDEAQKILDKISLLKKKDTAKINDALKDLYCVIPRKMSNVANYLLPNIDLDKSVVQEQDNIDAIASQVKAITKSKVADDKKEEDITLLDELGITMSKISKYPSEIDYIMKQLEKNKTGYSAVKIDSVYKVDKPTQNTRFDKWVKDAKNKKTSFLIHGTRCSSVLPILEQGLKIRPSGNYQFSGKAYGEGNYFSQVTDKSLGYTGWGIDKILLVFEVHTGNPFKYNGWFTGNSFTLSYKELSKRGYDCTHVSAGRGLLNEEIISYKEEQCTPRYIIHLK